MNRRKIVKKHSPRLKKIYPNAPLSLGNGDFGFSVDFTGLQSFPKEYVAPLSTQSNWGWHSDGGKDVYTLSDAPMQSYDGVPYPLYPEGQEDAYHWLRQNPHRIQLGQIGLYVLKENGDKAEAQDFVIQEQYHDLWTGILTSKFVVEDYPVTVMTACDPDDDSIGISIQSALLAEERLAIFLRFPNPNMIDRKWEKTTQILFKDEGHVTSWAEIAPGQYKINRQIDDSRYHLMFASNLARLEEKGSHELTVIPEVSEEFSLTVSFTPNEKMQPKKVEEVFQSSENHWVQFWQEGGFVSFEGSNDPRADELERRIVLSQYLTAIHSGGSVPPQETGFMYNSWFGKFHLEMHWWHGVHFPMWNRTSILEKSLPWYLKIFPKAKELAQSQGYRGVRWPKMTAVEGEQTPSPIAPGLIWQQPHPIALLEYCYQMKRDNQFLQKYQEIVFETAHFMADFARYDEENDVYHLGPNLIPSQENHKMEDAVDPPYELEYWYQGLMIAKQWAERLDEKVPKQWLEVAAKLARPVAKNGVYLAHANCLETYTEKNHDHPSMAAALGMLPGQLIDKKMMLNTLYKIRDTWRWHTAWGWDFPMCAMSAARLGELELAIDFLMMDEIKNTYLPNGHNYQHAALTAYLPGNGGLLTAVAMMAGKWGFPKNGKWNVQVENIHPLL